MTRAEIRRAMRAMNKNGETISTLLVPGVCQIKKIGNGTAPYAVGPLPEEDDSDPLTDYSAFVYGWRESWVLDYVDRARA